MYIALIASFIFLPIAHAVLNHWENYFKNGCNPYQNLKRVTIYTFVGLFLFYVFNFGASEGIISIVGWFLFLLVWTFATGFLHLCLFAASDVSMHIRILTEIYLAKELSYENLLAVYNKEKIIDNRLKRMLKMGVAELRNEKLVLKARFFIVRSRILAFFRALFALQDQTYIPDADLVSALVSDRR